MDSTSYYGVLYHVANNLLLAYKHKIRYWSQQNLRKYVSCPAWKLSTTSQQPIEHCCLLIFMSGLFPQCLFALTTGKACYLSDIKYCRGRHFDMLILIHTLCILQLLKSQFLLHCFNIWTHLLFMWCTRFSAN